MTRGVRWLVYNADERRLRAPVRFLLLPVVVGLFAVPVAVVLGWTSGAIEGPTWWLEATTALGVAIALGVLAAGVVLDRRRLAEYGLRLDRGWARAYGGGLALGVGLVLLVFALLSGFDAVRVTGTLQSQPGTTPLAGVLLGTVALLVVGFYEELLTRGYLVTNAAEGLAGVLGVDRAIPTAGMLSGLAFGAAHALNPGASLESTLSVVVAGLVLAFAYAVTGSLALPAGLHAGWNVALSVGLGFRVSGLAPAASLVGTRTTGSTALTGGAFGPEAGLVGLAAWITAALVVAAWADRRDALAFDARLAVPDLRWRE